MRKRRNTPITPPDRRFFFAVTGALTAVSVVLVGVLILGNLNDKWRVLDQGRIEALHDLRLLDEIVSRRLEIVDIQLLGLIDLMHARKSDDAGPKAIAAAVGEAATRFANLSSLTFFDPSGRPIASSEAAPPEPGVSEKAFFRQHRDAGQAFAISFSRPPASPATLRISRRVTAASGTFLGVLSAELSSEIFRPPLALTSNWSGYEIAFFSRDGRVVSFWPVADTALWRDDLEISGLPLMAALPDTARSAVGSEVYALDTAAVAVGPLSNAPLLIALASSTEEMLSEWRRKSRVHYLALLILAGVLVLSGGGLSIAATRRHARVHAGFETLVRVLRQSPAAVAIVDAKGRILFSNDRLATVSGRRRNRERICSRCSAMRPCFGQ